MCLPLQLLLLLLLMLMLTVTGHQLGAEGPPAGGVAVAQLAAQLAAVVRTFAQRRARLR